MKLTCVKLSIVMKETVIVLCLFLSGLFMQGQVKAQVLADSVADWQAAEANDGVVSQGEFNWEHGYISTYTGGGGQFYGWHQNPFFWEGPSDTCLNLSNCEIILGIFPISNSKVHRYVCRRIVPV